MSQLGEGDAVGQEGAALTVRRRRIRGYALEIKASQVVVADQEADIYSHFARRPAQVELLVRARHDRALEGGGKLFEQTASWPVHTEVLERW